MLAHELRNPLAPLQNALNLLDQPGLGPEGQQQARQVIARQLRHLGRLVDNLLDVARVSQGRVKLRPSASIWPGWRGRPWRTVGHSWRGPV